MRVALTAVIVDANRFEVVSILHNQLEWLLAALAGAQSVVKRIGVERATVDGDDLHSWHHAGFGGRHEEIGILHQSGVRELQSQ